MDQSLTNKMFYWYHTPGRSTSVRGLTIGKEVTARAGWRAGRGGRDGRWCSIASPTACWWASRRPCSPTPRPRTAADWSGSTARRPCCTTRPPAPPRGPPTASPAPTTLSRIHQLAPAMYSRPTAAGWSGSTARNHAAARSTARPSDCVACNNSFSVLCTGTLELTTENCSQ